MIVLGCLIGGANAIAQNSGQQEDQEKKPNDVAKKIYSDEVIQFPLPEGAKVSPIPSENTHIIYTDDGNGIYYIRRVGVAENPAFSKKRAENSHADLMKKLGVAVKDGDSKVTIGKVSKIFERSVENQIHFLITYDASVISDEGNGSALTTMGYGNHGGHALWYFHTGPDAEKHPSEILSFLKTITWKKQKPKPGP
ncbi:hypothetical protein [Oceaniferula spumae]